MRASTFVAILSLAAGLASSVALPLPAMKFGRAPQRSVPDNSQHQVSEGPPLPPPSPPPPPPVCPPPPPPHKLNAPPPHPGCPLSSPLHNLNAAPPPPPDNPPPQTSDNPLPASFDNPLPASPMRHANFFMLNGGAARSTAVDRTIDQPNSRRELLERFDQLIKLASRAYKRELHTAHMDDLD